MLQEFDFYSLKETDMTLIVTIQSDDSVVIAADGMAYSGSGSDGNTPYPTQKLQVANNAWVFGFTGYAGPASIHKEVEAEIAAGKLGFDVDLDMSARSYFDAICQRMEKTHVPPDVRGTMILAGCGESGLVIKKADLCKIDNRLQFSFLEGAAGITGYGSKSPTAKAIIEMFIKCCPTPEALKELATFSIWRVSLQELVVGRMENDYQISTCILSRNKPPQIESLPIEATLKRMQEWKECLEQSCSSLFERPQ
jgi:hypothetical protein